MKKLLLLFIVILSPFVVNAQFDKYYREIKGTMVLPESEKYITLKFDFSKTIFDNKYSEEDWALLKGKEVWEEAKQEALERIAVLMNEKMTKTRIIIVLEKMMSQGDNSVVSNYTLYITPHKYYSKGKNESTFVLKNNKSGEFVGSISAYGSGGSFGSIGNLLGDAFEKSAPEVAKIIAKKNKNK